jgi:hypothetical protein
MMERFGHNLSNVFNFKIKAWARIQYYKDVVLPKLQFSYYFLNLLLSWHPKNPLAGNPKNSSKVWACGTFGWFGCGWQPVELGSVPGYNATP